MGKRGPAKKPTKLKLLQGNPGEKKLNENEPEPVVENDDPKPPSWLNKTAKGEWERVVSELRRLELLSLVDHPSFAAYCQSYGRFVEAEKIIKKQGMTFTTDNGYIQQRPEVGIANKSMEHMKKFAGEFGLTPASRSNLSINDEKKTKDEFEEFLKNGSG
jgi:P27 family predicted phage terminase small subunit